MITLNITYYDANCLHSHYYLAYQGSRGDLNWSRGNNARGSPIHIWIVPGDICISKKEPFGITPRGSFLFKIQEGFQIPPYPWVTTPKLKDEYGNRGCLQQPTYAQPILTPPYRQECGSHLFCGYGDTKHITRESKPMKVCNFYYGKKICVLKRYIDT